MLDGLRHDWGLLEQTFRVTYDNGKDYLPVQWTCKFCYTTVNKRYEKPNAILK